MEGSLVAYKVFTNGSVLNASEVNENLMNQAVITFSNSTVRASAITSPVEGMITYLEDTQNYESWNGSAWIRIVPESSGNVIINGAFEINQRNFTSSTTAGAYGFDRWIMGAVDGTTTMSAQTFTPGTAPLSGIEATNFVRLISTGQTLSTAVSLLAQRVEDVRTVTPGKPFTISFYARAGSGTPNISLELTQAFGSGGSPSVNTFIAKLPLTTSWQRLSFTFTAPSITGKTIAAGNNANFNLYVSRGSDGDSRTGSLGIQSNTFDIWGVQVEAGSVATPFRRNANSLQGELAACQRYYQQSYSTGATPGTITTSGNIAWNAVSTSSDRNYVTAFFLTQMRASPTVTLYSPITGATGRAYNAITSAGDKVASTNYINQNSFSAFIGPTDGANAVGDLLLVHYVASAEL
jgi:hypothetical protein